MISAFAQASQVLENPFYLRVAERAASFILREMRNENGLLLHTYKDGHARFIGYQDDYAFLIAGLIDLYEATFEMTWLQKAEELCDSMVDQFWDDGEGGFFFAGPHHESLIVRSKNPYDNAIPSGNSVGVMDLMRLGILLDREGLRDRASQTLRLFQPFMVEVPTGFGQMLCSLNFFLEGPHEVAIVGSPEDPQTQELLQAVAGNYVPNRVVALKDPDKPDELTERIKLLANKVLVGGRPAAYVCRNFACDTPVTDASELEPQLIGS